MSMLTHALRLDLVHSNSEVNFKRTSTSLQQHDVIGMRELVNRSLVGHLVSRTGGRLALLTYLITSAQAIVYKSNSVVCQTPKSHSNNKSKQECLIGRGSSKGLIGGFLARIGLCPRLACSDENPNHRILTTVQRLPFIPLVTLQKDSSGSIRYFDLILIFKRNVCLYH